MAGTWDFESLRFLKNARVPLFKNPGKIDLEKLITTNPIWDFFAETFDLLSARPFENLVREGVYRFHLFIDLVTKILVPRSWYQDPLILIPRSWYQDPGTKILVPRSWYQDPGTKILLPRSWYQDLGTRILVPGYWYQDLVTKILVPGSRYQDPGTKISS